MNPRLRKITIFCITVLSIAGYGFFVFAAAPVGGYLPGQTNNPSCAPNDLDCKVVALSIGQAIGLGTPGQVLYTDGYGQLFGDDDFFRDSSTHATAILAGNAGFNMTSTSTQLGYIDNGLGGSVARYRTSPVGNSLEWDADTSDGIVDTIVQSNNILGQNIKGNMILHADSATGANSYVLTGDAVLLGAPSDHSALMGDINLGTGDSSQFLASYGIQTQILLKDNVFNPTASTYESMIDLNPTALYLKYGFGVGTPYNYGVLLDATGVIIGDTGNTVNGTVLTVDDPNKQMLLGASRVAIGSTATASGDNSFSMGNSTLARSFGETALGIFTTNYSPASTTVFNTNDRLLSVGNGTGTGFEHNAFTLYKDGSYVFNDDNTTWNIGEESKSYFNMSNRSIRMGSVDADTWEGSNVGTRSIALGFADVGNNLRAPKASGPHSIAFGAGTLANGSYATAFGYGTTANSYGTAFGSNTAAGTGGTAFGNSTSAGTNGTAFGNNTSAAGTSTAFGSGTQASGYYATAFGFNTTAAGFYTTTFGHGSSASGFYSTAFGYNSTVDCVSCVAFGDGSIANAASAVAFGDSATASGNAAVAFGYRSLASGIGATAFGSNTVASGTASTAFGIETFATGDRSTAFGIGTTADSYGETAIGFYPSFENTTSQTSSVPGDRLLTIGNGDDEFNRSDAFTILKNGQVGVAIDNFETNTNANPFQVGDGTTGVIGYVDGGTGNWVAVSDARTKRNISDINYGLAELLQLHPVQYEFKRNGEHAIGFVAQEVQPIIPDVVFGDDKQYGIAYQALVPVTVKAIQELDIKISTIESFANAQNTSFKDSLIAWFGNTANGIGDLFAKKIHVEQVCVGTNGNETCVSKDQLDDLLQGGGVPLVVSVPTIPSVSDTSSATSSVIVVDSTTTDSSSEVVEPPIVIIPDPAPAPDPVPTVPVEPIPLVEN